MTFFSNVKMAAINMQISRRCCWGVELIWALFVPSAGPKKKEETQIRRRKSSFTAGAPSLCADQCGGAT